MSVAITTDAAGLIVTTPYDAEFVESAKELNGVPLKSADGWRWTFDLRDEDRVRALCVRIFGTDGSDADEPTLTVRVPVPSWGTSREFRAAGLTLARRPYRDGRVQLGAGVVLVDGGFAHSGGSANNPRLEAKPGTVVEVRDLPRGAAELILTQVKGSALVDGVDQHRAVLLAERDALLARLAEINALLGDNQPQPT
jgi:hypothetical protein